MTPMRPLADRVLIKRMAELEETAGGLLIPENAREKGQYFTVEAVGPGRIFAVGLTRSQIAAALAFLSIDEMGKAIDALEGLGIRFGQRVAVSVQVGDVVLMGRYAGTDLKIDGVDYSMVRDEEIMAIVPRSSQEPGAGSQHAD